jgi:Xaa-Pro aminopeptidase
MTTPIITGKHRAKISAWQDPSPETIEYAKSLNMHVLGPGELAESEWATAGLPKPDLAQIRNYRLERVRQKLREFDYAGILLYDPINTRYATDSTNMQLWITHNAARYSFVATEGPVIVFEFHGCGFLNYHTPIVTEVRPATTYYYFAAGEHYAEKAKIWAEEIADLVISYGGGNKRLALDHATAEGIHALEAHGIEIMNGEEVMELARVIKSDEEIKAMRRAMVACERSMDVMQANFHPGITEQRLWSYLHAENIARGGEWIETRLLAAGPRTNPWFQECSSRKIQNGELMGFDTDLIGSYGLCVDISRTWLCGDVRPTPEQKEIYTMAYEQIQKNTEILRPGITFKELSQTAVTYPRDEFRHYSTFYHGVGLCDEYPGITFPWYWNELSPDGVLTPGMVLCVESFVGRYSGGPGVKLEDQVLITEDGYEVLSHYAYEEDLLG